MSWKFDGYIKIDFFSIHLNKNILILWKKKTVYKVFRIHRETIILGNPSKCYKMCFKILFSKYAPRIYRNCLLNTARQYAEYWNTPYTYTYCYYTYVNLRFGHALFERKKTLCTFLTSPLK